MKQTWKRLLSHSSWGRSPLYGWPMELVLSYIKKLTGPKRGLARIYPPSKEG
ncbi:hypothetical protein SCLCIDRAFT_1223821 [Scleroderma citrinum Foug A]|uniref:Uncharacterized protein n=1 Tax=Scleroderma citrinum Foug A TaxID=1036808 RepID=A0A0C3D7F5_9AGAM|nr:hypothetical protein SCLCIDRAFT_1223821 [Scleroderma citrinum Foug A]